MEPTISSFIFQTIASFAVSVAAGNVPLIKTWFNGNKNLEDHVRECFRKALRAWSVNKGIREIEEHRWQTHLEELREFLAGESKSKEYDSLVRLWVEELRKDDVCYSFIIEHKQEIHDLRMQEGFAQVMNQLHLEHEKDREELTQIEVKLDEIKNLFKGLNNSSSGEETVNKLLSVLNNSVASLIEKLQLDSALSLLNDIENSFSELITRNTQLKAKIKYQKGLTLFFDQTGKAFSLFHDAYELAPQDPGIKEKEAQRLLYKGAYEEAKQICLTLPENNVMRIVTNVLISDDVEAAYRQLPSEHKEDYRLRYEILSIRGNSDIESTFLFDDKEVAAYQDLTYSNIFGWMFALTCHNVNLGGLLLLALNPDMVNFDKYQEAFNFAEQFYRLLSTREVERSLRMVKLQYCYWGFVLDRHESWIDEVMKIDPKDLKHHQDHQTLDITSMLMVKERYSEAFANIASMRSKITVNIANYVILMAFWAKNIDYLKWIFDVRRENGFKFNPSSAKYIAFNVFKNTSKTILQLIKEEDFGQNSDYEALKQLCLHYSDGEVDVNRLKALVNSLSEPMKPYVAMVLSKHGEAELAEQILPAKAGDSPRDLGQRIALGIMAQIPSKRSQLYRLLTEERKKGALCDDEILSIEFECSMQMEDYDNALEVVEELIKRHPDDEDVKVHHLKLLGRLHPEKLKEYEREMVSFSYSHPSYMQKVYQVFAENKYLDCAAEILYQYVLVSNDWGVKTYYFNEGSQGYIKGVVSRNYPTAEVGLFAICDMGDDNRSVFPVEIGNDVGEKLLGHQEGDSVVCEINGKNVELTIVHVVDKYGKLSLDILLESCNGSNPFMKPITIDPEKPFESFEKAIDAIGPSNQDYLQQLKELQEAYERGEKGLIHLVSHNQALEDTYSCLFSSSKVIVEPWQRLNQISFSDKAQKDVTFVLDITAVILFFEFQQKTGCCYPNKFVVSSSTYEFVLKCSKSSDTLSLFDLKEALDNQWLKRYNDYLSKDVKIRLNKLVQWMDKYCKKEMSDVTLEINHEGKSKFQVMTMNTLLLLLNKPMRCLITDDRFFMSQFGKHMRIISTETYIYMKQIEVTAYRELLMASNYMGIFLPREMIVKEYAKMEQGQKNYISYIMQDAMYNVYLFDEIVNASIRIVQTAHDILSARLTITNMLLSCLKSANPEIKGQLVNSVITELRDDILGSAEVKECMLDAARISHVIMLQ